MNHWCLEAALELAVVLVVPMEREEPGLVEHQALVPMVVVVE
jgi:hypothetical protein